MAETGRIVSPVTLAELIGLAKHVPEIATDILSENEILPAGSYTRRPPLILDTQDAHELTRVRCAQYMTRLTQAYGPVHHAALRDATVLGDGTVVMAGGALLVDSCWEHFSQGRVPDGLHRSETGRLRLASSSAKRVVRPSLLVKRPFWSNYGHWLLDAATVLALVPRLALPPDCQIIIGSFGDSRMGKVVRKTCDQLVPGMKIVEQPDDEVWEFAVLHYVTPPHISPFITHPTVLAELSTRLCDTPSVAPAGRRIFVERPPDRGRALGNHDEVINACERHHFEVVRPEEHSLQQQMAMFGSAQCVVGVKGAALTNVMFCAKGARVLALSPSDWSDPFFWDLATQLGVDYGEMFGRIRPDDEPQSMHAFDIDLQRFDAHLATLCDAVPVPSAVVPR